MITERIGLHLVLLPLLINIQQHLGVFSITLSEFPILFLPVGLLVHFVRIFQRKLTIKNVALHVIIGICRSKSLSQAILYKRRFLRIHKCFRTYYIQQQDIRTRRRLHTSDNRRTLIRTVYFSLRIHISGHATKPGCFYFEFRQSSQRRPSLKLYSCIPDLFDEIALISFIAFFERFLPPAQNIHYR